MNYLKIIRILSLITCFSSLAIGQANAGPITTIFDVEITSTSEAFGAFNEGDSYSFQFIHDDSIFQQINRYDDGADGIANTEDDFFSEIFLAPDYQDVDSANEFDLSLNPFQDFLDDWFDALTQNNAVALDVFDQNTRFVARGEGLGGTAAGYTSDSVDMFVGAYDTFQGANFYAFYTDINNEEVNAEIDFKITGYTVVPEPSTLAIFALSLMGLASRRCKKGT
jgi:hypothetical protein